MGRPCAAHGPGPNAVACGDMHAKGTKHGQGRGTRRPMCMQAHGMGQAVCTVHMTCCAVRVQYVLVVPSRRHVGAAASPGSHLPHVVIVYSHSEAHLYWLAHHGVVQVGHQHQPRGLLTRPEGEASAAWRGRGRRPRHWRGGGHCPPAAATRGAAAPPALSGSKVRGREARQKTALRVVMVYEAVAVADGQDQGKALCGSTDWQHAIALTRLIAAKHVHFAALLPSFAFSVTQPTIYEWPTNELNAMQLPRWGAAARPTQGRSWPGRAPGGR